jgi:hypothetical protein
MRQLFLKYPSRKNDVRAFVAGIMVVVAVVGRRAILSSHLQTRSKPGY